MMLEAQQLIEIRWREREEEEERLGIRRDEEEEDGIWKHCKERQRVGSLDTITHNTQDF